MRHGEGESLLRTMTPAHVADVLAVQEPGAVVTMADVFPQDRYPFPRAALSERWLREIADPDCACFVVVVDDLVSGFAATRGDELFHFGIAMQHWGSGLANEVHDAVLARIEDAGFERAWADVYAGNTRARRFYEKLGWTATGARSRGPMPPHAELLRYERALGASAAGTVPRSRAGRHR